MYEHGLIPSDYTKRPIYQTERSVELQHELHISSDLVDDMLCLPNDDANTVRLMSLEGGGCKILREFSYHHPQHQEVISLRLDYESRPLYKSETYGVAIDTYPEDSYTTEAAMTTYYILHKNADIITSASIQSIDLEHGGYYPERSMTVYDAQQLFNELAEFSVTACQSLDSE